MRASNAPCGFLRDGRCVSRRSLLSSASRPTMCYAVIEETQSPPPPPLFLPRAMRLLLVAPKPGFGCARHARGPRYFGFALQVFDRVDVGGCTLRGIACWDPILHISQGWHSPRCAGSPGLPPACLRRFSSLVTDASSECLEMGGNAPRARWMFALGRRQKTFVNARARRYSRGGPSGPESRKRDL